MGCAFDVATGAANEIAHQIIDISADIACLAELRGIRLHKGDADEICRRADEVRLPNAGGPEQEDILFLIERSFFAFQGEAHMLEVVAEGHAEDFFRLVLANDKAVEMPSDIRRLQAKREIL